MQVIREVPELRAWRAEQRRRGRSVGFVPTMGNLHAGHHSLIDLARERSDAVIASIFVNPTQFGVGEDFARYPRTPDEDARGLREKGCDAVFLPTVEAIYPFGMDAGMRVRVAELGGILEGASRPGHFDGVATVVAKLFNLVAPDRAVFGSKDFQQLLVVRRMCTDLAFPVEIVAAPIVREANGLAMSSRNQFLDADQRDTAAVIHATLLYMRERVRSGDASLAEIESEAAATLSRAGLAPDYAALRNAGDLAAPVPSQRRDLVALIAARLGSVRLIDNLEIDV
jgi:pantoate--beta-alanine ligase